MTKFSVSTKLTQKEYCKLFVRMSYRQRLYQIITIMGIALLVLSIARFFIKSIVSSNVQIFLLAFSLYCLLLFPLVVWLRAKKVYKTNTGLQDAIQYTFTDTDVTIKGGDIETRFEWEKFSKTIETKTFLLMLNFNRAAYFLKIKDLTEEQIKFIKTKIEDQYIIAKA